ncbi:MAG: flagellin lysine-N-methylase [Geothrix sp.]|nr:flagellin lysine-N-methylase [Geothrix sp.]
MKNLVTETMLMPVYATRFACTGGACEDTCCQGWTVTLDKKSFLQYQSTPDPILRPLVARHVQRNPESRSADDYGCIKLCEDAGRSCPFLNEARLCLLYERLGEKALSSTCADYPRGVFRIGDLHQLTLSLSCPEAARQALLREDAFELVGHPHTVNSETVLPVTPKFGLTVETMDEVRTLNYQLLQSRNIPVEDRLKLVGLFCSRLEERLRIRKLGSVPQLVAEFDADLKSGAALAVVRGERPSAQAQLVAALFAEGRKIAHSPHADAVLDEIARGWGIQQGRCPEGDELAQTFEAGLARLEPALAAIPWLLEHFLLNEALREYFPWSCGSPWQHYKWLTVRFALTRFMLVGRAMAQETPLTSEELAETVQVSCRCFAHNGEAFHRFERVIFQGFV